MKFIIYNPIKELFTFFINALKNYLDKINIKIINTIKNENIDFKKDIILIIINPHFIYDYKNIYDDIIFISSNYKYKIFYITEPINFIIEKKVFTDLIKIIKPYCIWTYTSENIGKLNIYQNIYNIYPKFNKELDFINISLNNIKERNSNSIIFFGNINENRIQTCNQFNNYLINKKESWSKEEWSNILNENLFYLNIHRRCGCKSFEAFRIIPILANGGFIFSEKTNEIDETEYKDYNIIFCNKKDLYETFINFKNNIDYNSIYEKALLYRINNLDKNDELEKYFEYHNKIV